jgi:Tfp pilus assembly protein PilV
MNKNNKYRLEKLFKGFSLVEVLLAISIFVLFVSVIVITIIYGEESAALGGARSRASIFANEGLEAMRNIRDANFSNLTDNTSLGIGISSNQWAFIGSSDTSPDGRFNRQIGISAVDVNTKLIKSKVTWSQNLQRNGSVELSTYFTNWRMPKLNGMLVYGDGGTSSDSIKYKIFDPEYGTWGPAQSAADIDSGSTNKYLRAVKIYSSPIKNEKVMISRHYTGVGGSQFIYAQVFNGTTWSSSSVKLLSSWAATNYLDVQNFDGTYLSNGNFMANFRNGSSTAPQFIIWDTSSSNWGSAVNMRSSGGIPTYITTKLRPGTSNEVMVVVFDQQNDTNTQYYDGSGSATTDWTAHSEHSGLAPSATRRHADFEWSLNAPTTGALVYTDSATDKTLTVKLFVANGSGGGAWGTAVNSASAQTNNLGSMDVITRPGVNELHACNKDSVSASTIVCRKITFSGNVPTITNPVNPIVASVSDTGIQKSFDFSFETISGNPAVIVYSDNTNVPKIKKYAADTSTWDSAATSVAISPFTPTSPIRTVRALGNSLNDDILYLFSDSNTSSGRDLYSIAWNGTTNAMYSSSGLGITQHGTSGSADADYWYDFAWDKY